MTESQSDPVDFTEKMTVCTIYIPYMCIYDIEYTHNIEITIHLYMYYYEDMGTGEKFLNRTAMACAVRILLFIQFKNVNKILILNFVDLKSFLQESSAKITIKAHISITDTHSLNIRDSTIICFYIFVLCTERKKRLL
jgi:hypothetical protein